MLKKSHWIKTLLIGVLLLILAGCGSNSSTKPAETGSKEAESKPTIDKITIAAQTFSEPLIVDYMIKEVIEDKTDIKVEIQKTAGLSSLLHSLLEKNEIQIYMGYAGTQFQKILKGDYTDEYRQSSDKVIDYITEKEMANHGIWVSPKLGFWDNYAITVSAETAQKYNLKNFSDIAPYAKDWNVGMDQDFQAIKDTGMPGLKEAYNLQFKKETAMDYNLMYQALANNSVQAIVGYSTDARLKKLNQVPLVDDKNFLPPEHAVVLILDSVRKEAKLDEILAPLWGAISTEEMIELNFLADIEKKDPAVIAHDFLVKKGIVK